MKKRLLALVTLLFSLMCTQTLAANLIDVFKQAMASDPTIKNARALVEVAQQGVPIARSTLLPNLDISGTLLQERKYLLGDTGGFGNTSSQYSLTLAQPIFNYAGWMAVKNASALVKQAVANYYATAQQVMFDTARAYFTVLQNTEILRFTTAEKRALARQLEQNEERFKVGLVAITDVLEVRAQYDTVAAQEIAAENNISNALEDLRELTGKTYTILMGATRQYPLVSPQPADINAWVDTALKQNYSVQAARFLLLSDRANIKQQAAGRYPVFSAIGSIVGDRETRFTPPGPGTGSGKIFSHTAGVGVQLNFPAYQGGLIGANTRQARHQLNADSAALEKTIRTIANQTRQSYLNVMTGISKIKADRQTILSSRKALEASEAAFTVGQRTIVDVLLSQSALYQSEQTFAQDQYTYILDGLQLKQLAGTLSLEDFQAVNRWLTKSVNVARFSRRAQGLNHWPKVSSKRKTTRSVNKKTSSTKSTHKKPSMQKNYAIQLMSTTKKPDAQQFIKRHNLNNTKVVTKKVAGKTRFVVLYGQFNAYSKAKAALGQLPKSLQTLKPWVVNLK